MFYSIKNNKKFEFYSFYKLLRPDPELDIDKIIHKYATITIKSESKETIYYIKEIIRYEEISRLKSNKAMFKLTKYKPYAIKEILPDLKHSFEAQIEELDNCDISDVVKTFEEKTVNNLIERFKEIFAEKIWYIYCLGVFEKPMFFNITANSKLVFFDDDDKKDIEWKEIIKDTETQNVYILLE